MPFVPDNGIIEEEEVGFKPASPAPTFNGGGGSFMPDSGETDVSVMFPEKKPLTKEIGDNAKDVAIGVSQQQLKTLRGVSMVPVAAANLIYEGVNKVFGTKIPKVQPFLGSNMKEDLLVAKNAWQKMGQFGESMIEFLAPAGAITTTAKTLGAGASAAASAAGAAPVVKGALNLGVQSLVQGGAAGLTTAAQTNKFGNEAKVNAIVSAAFPWISAAAEKIVPKVMESIIKPTEADYKNGFKNETLSEFGLHGNITSVKTKVENKMNGLVQQLNQKFADTPAVVDVKSVMDKTIKEATDYKSIQLGQVADRNAAIADLKNDMDDFIGLFDSTDAPIELTKVPIKIANDQIKRGAGTKGSWVYGRVPHDKAVDYLYSKFYNNLKVAIEKSAEQNGIKGISQLNNSLHKLIPVSSALTRAANRLSKNNAVGLVDSLFLIGSVFNPASLAVYGPYYASRSGSFAGLLQTAQDHWVTSGVKAGVKAGISTDESQE